MHSIVVNMKGILVIMIQCFIASIFLFRIKQLAIFLFAFVLIKFDGYLYFARSEPATQHGLIRSYTILLILFLLLLIKVYLMMSRSVSLQIRHV